MTSRKPVMSAIQALALVAVLAPDMLDDLASKQRKSTAPTCTKCGGALRTCGATYCARCGRIIKKGGESDG